MHNHFTQAEGVANLDQVPEAGALITIGFAKPLGGSGGYARYVAFAPADWPHGVTIAEAPGAPLPKQTAPRRRGPDGGMRPTPQERLPIAGAHGGGLLSMSRMVLLAMALFGAAARRQVAHAQVRAGRGGGERRRQHGGQRQNGAAETARGQE